MALVANEDWLRLLAEAGRILWATLDAESSLQPIADLAVPRLCDWCCITLTDAEGRVAKAAYAYGTGPRRDVLMRLQERYPFRPDAPHGLAKVLRSGQPELVPEIPAEAYGAMAQDEEHLRLLTALNLRSLLIVPLRARGRTLGAVSFGLTDTLRRYGEEDKAWADELALRIALSVDNSRLYRETREQAEVLRQRESLYRALTENIPVMAWMTDPAGKPLYFNRQCAEFAGRPIGPGTDVADLGSLIHPDDRAAVQATRRGALEREQPYRCEFRLRRADGEYRWHVSRSAPVRDARGELEAWFGSALDVHELREAEMRLAGSEAEMRALFEYSGVGLAEVDARTGRILRVNPKLCEITGYSRGELEGMAFGSMTHPDDADRDRQMLQRLVEEGRAYWMVEKRFVRKDGSLRWVQVHGARLPAADGRPLRLTASVHDVTERRLAEEAARLAREKMVQSQRVEAIGRLAGGIAHDFNNLLTAINGYADLLLPRFAGEASVRGYLAEIRQAGEKAALLTQQMLAYGRRQMLDPRLTDAAGVVRRMGEMLGRMLGETVRLEVRAPGSAGPVLVDQGKLEQALVNLALNARDAMPEGGTLALSSERVRLAEHQEAFDAIIPPGEYALLSVEDTGTGIDPAVQSRMFEPFFTTKGMGADPEGRTGSGLGLSMVWGFVKQSGGYIQVESAPGKGSRFRILLPLALQDEIRRPSAPALEAPASGPKRTVLVVEDEDAVRRFACTLLSKAGYVVLDAPNGETALALLDSHRGEVDLLLTDVIMPGMMGTRLAEEARRRRPGLETVFMTGYSDQTVFEYGLLIASDGLLKKPFSSRTLLDRVREALEAPAPPARLKVSAA
jgi:PAS domain S-box-containing protein